MIPAKWLGSLLDRMVTPELLSWFGVWTPAGLKRIEVPLPDQRTIWELGLRLQSYVPCDDSDDTWEEPLVEASKSKRGRKARRWADEDLLFPSQELATARRRQQYYKRAQKKRAMLNVKNAQ